MNNSTHVPLLLSAPRDKDLQVALFKEDYPRIDTLGLVRKVKVYELRDHKPKLVDERTIAGIQALIPGVFLLRIWSWEGQQNLLAEIKAAELEVRSLAPEFRLLPSHPGWVKRTPEGGTFMDVLFGKVKLNDEPNLANSRLTRLIGHLDEMSRYLGKRRFFIARGNHPWADHDGACLLNPSRFHTPWRTLKIFAPGIFGSDYLENGAPTVKCCGEFNRGIWRKACRHFGIDPMAFDGIVPEISLKFDDGRAELEAETFSVFDTVPGRHFTVTLQMLMNVPLTDAVHTWAAEKVIAKVKELREAYEDMSGHKVARLLDKTFKEAADLLEGEIIDEDDLS